MSSTPFQAAPSIEPEVAQFVEGSSSGQEYTWEPYAFQSPSYNGMLISHFLVSSVVLSISTKTVNNAGLPTTP